MSGVSLRNVRAVTAEAVTHVNRHTDELARLSHDLQVVARRLKDVDALLDAHLSLTFWGRLKFLIKGRHA